MRRLGWVSRHGVGAAVDDTSRVWEEAGVSSLGCLLGLLNRAMGVWVFSLIRYHTFSLSRLIEKRPL